MARYHTPTNLVGGFWNAKNTHLAPRCLKMIMHISTFYQQPPSKSSIFLNIIFAKILFNRQNLSKQIPPWQMRFWPHGQNSAAKIWGITTFSLECEEECKIFQEKRLWQFFLLQWRRGGWQLHHETKPIKLCFFTQFY